MKIAEIAVLILFGKMIICEDNVHFQAGIEPKTKRPQ